MLDFETCKKLKEYGFPQRHKNYEYGMGYDDKGNVVYFNPCCEYWSNAVPIVDIPSLSELIEACGEWFELLHHDKYVNTWHCNTGFNPEQIDYLISESTGKTPEEAVANLYIALNS